MRIYVKRENWDGGLWVSLPISDTEAERVMEELKQAHPSFMIPFIGGADSELQGLEEALVGELVFEDRNLERLNQLVEAMEGMSREERFRFQGAVIMEKPRTLEDVLTTLNHRKQYSLHEGITSYEELGRYAIYREGKKIPKELEAFFDYEHQGRFWGQKHGCMTEGGWVERDFHEAEKEQKAVEEKQLDAVFVLEVRQETPEVHYERFSLPLPDEELEKKIEQCRSKGQEVVKIKGTSLTENLYEFLPPGCSLKELNGIAGEVRRLAQRTRISWMRLLGALEAETPQSAREARQVIRNYEDYELLPRKTKDPESYARYVLEQKGPEIPENIRRYIRLKEWGQKMSMEVGLVETSYGMIVNHKRPIRREEWKEEEFCLYNSLSIFAYDKEQDSSAPKPLSGKEAFAFKEVIKRKVEQCLKKDMEHGLADHLKNRILRQKVRAMIPKLKEQQGELKGSLLVKARTALTEAEKRALLEEWEEIARFGWGEKLYENPVSIGNREIYIGFFEEKRGESSLKGLLEEDHQKEEEGFKMNM